MKNVVYMVVVLVAAAAGYAIYQFGIAPNLAPSAALEPQVSAEPQMPAAAQEPTPALPAVLPEFSLVDRSGELRSIASWPGKSMIINFWATWCAPCRREIPLLNELQRKYGNQEDEAGFQVVGVAVDFRDDVLEYAEEIGIDYPLLIGEQEGLEAVNAFGVESVAFPFTVFTDSQARIVMYHLGELKPPQAEVILATVERVNGGELTPAAARTVAARQLAELSKAEES